MVSVALYWLPYCSPKMSTSTGALAGTSMIPLICSRARVRVRARHSLWPHTVWSSRMAALRDDESTWQVGLAKATISSSSRAQPESSSPPPGDTPAVAPTRHRSWWDGGLGFLKA